MESESPLSSLSFLSPSNLGDKAVKATATLSQVTQLLRDKGRVFGLQNLSRPWHMVVPLTSCEYWACSLASRDFWPGGGIAVLLSVAHVLLSLLQF